jgi:hypothetical protein
VTDAVRGSCHCGAVRITASRRPDDITECNCSLCVKTGFRGVYFASSELRIDGDATGYVRSDIDEPMIRIFHCPTCGCLTHWEPLTPPPHARMGVNARLLERGALDGRDVRQVDGASW